MLLSIKNEQGREDTHEQEASLIDDTERGVTSHRSSPFKERGLERSRARRTLADRKEACYDKDMQSIKSQTLFSNYYSGKSS